MLNSARKWFILVVIMSKGQTMENSKEIQHLKNENRVLREKIERIKRLIEKYLPEEKQQ